MHFLFRHLWFVRILILCLFSTTGQAQFTFNSGNIYPCDTNVFMCPMILSDTVLYSSTTAAYNKHYLSMVDLEITTIHPEKLKITLTSPQGTTIELSTFNGNGGINFQNCQFLYNSTTSIIGATAPFTGHWKPQTGNIDASFVGENPNGNWLLTIIDTSCTNIHGSSGGSSTGYLHGTGSASGSSGMGLGTGSSTGPCNGSIPNITDSICIGQSYNIATPYTSFSSIYNISFFQNGIPVAQPLAVTQAGNYIIQAFDPSDGCTYNGLVELHYHTPEKAGPDTTLNLPCHGIPIDLNTFLQVSPSTVSWYNNFSPIASVNSVIDTGQYMAVHTNIYSCTDTTFITLLPASTFSLGQDSSITGCSNTSIDLPSLYPMAGTSAVWTFNNLQVTAPGQITQPGTYTLIASDSGCIDTAQVFYYQNQSPSLGNDQSIAICPQPQYDLTSYINTAGLSTYWEYQGTAINNPSAVNSAGLYTLIATDTNNCSDTIDIQITNFPVPNLGPSQQDTICSNAPIDITALFNYSGLSAFWYFNGTPTTAPVAAATDGNYMLIGTDTNGCADTTNFLLTVLQTPFIGNDTSITHCENLPVVFSSLFNLSGGTVTWYTNNQQIINPGATATSGSYDAILTTAAGCMDTAIAALIFLPSPHLGPDQQYIICNGDSLPLATLYTTAGTSFNWTYNSSIFNQQCATQAGNYLLIATSPNGCTDSANVLLTVNPTPALQQPLQAFFCEGTTVNAEQLINATGYINQWTCNNAPISQATSITLPGNYTVISTNNVGCSATSNVQILFNPTPQLGTDQTVSICEPDSIALNTYFTIGSYPSSWSLNNLPYNNSGWATTTGIYSLIAQSDSGCSDTALLILTVHALPQPGEPSPLTVCDGSIIDLTNIFNTSGYSCSWSQGGINITQPTAITQNGTYTLIATSSAGCSDTTFVDITFAPLPQIGTDVQIEPCDGTIQNLETYFSTSGLQTTWTMNGNLVSNQQQILLSGLYEVIATDSLGCSDTAHITVNFLPTPDPGPDTLYQLCPWHALNLIELYPPGNYITDYYFNGNKINGSLTVTEAGLYTVIQTAPNGCTGHAVTTIESIDCKCEADFKYEARCLQDPVNFSIIADSAISSANWTFSGYAAPNQTLDPQVFLRTTDSITVYAMIELSCGSIETRHTIALENCSDSCHSWIPNAFTPNNDLKNDTFSWQGDCQPEKFTLDIYNRFGQRVFHTSDPEAGWTGTANGVEVGGGIYSYNIHLKLPYKDETDLSGKLMLIR